VFKIAEKEVKYFEKEEFKILEKADTYIIDQYHFERDFFHFNSDFSLLSDEHFLNVLVSGYRRISVYLRCKNNFTHLIDEQVYSRIN